MANPNGLRAVFLLIPPVFILLPLSIIIIVLERISSSLFETHTPRNWRTGQRTISLSTPATDDTPSRTYTNVSVRIRYEPTLIILGLCVVAIFVAAISICGIWELRRIEGSRRRQRGWSWIMLILNLSMVGASVGVLVHLSALQGNEKKWQSYADAETDGQRFTREAWVCQINEFYSSTQGWAGPACGLEKAARFMLIPLAISSALVILCTWMLIHVRGGVKWLFGGKGRYAGFDNIMELQPPRQELAKGSMPNNQRMVYS